MQAKITCADLDVVKSCLPIAETAELDEEDTEKINKAIGLLETMKASYDTDEYDDKKEAIDAWKEMGEGGEQCNAMQCAHAGGTQDGGCTKDVRQA